MQTFLFKGYEVVALAPHDDAVESQLKKLNIKYISIPIERNGLNPLRDIGLIKKLYSIIRIEKPNIVFSYTIKPIIYGSIATRLGRVKKIYSMITGTGYIFSNTNFKSKIIGYIARSLFRFALKFNTLVFFQNKDNLNLFKQLKIISNKKSTAIINGSGVDCQNFMPAEYPSDISFLMISRFLHDKGIREYVDAARKIKQKYPYIKFKLVGWIDTNPNSISQQELDCWIAAGIVEYLGKLPDVRAAIADASVYVLPSYYEGTPRTVLEAMAMARPIITTDAPGCRETVMPQKNGFLVPIKNSEELYKTMEYFIKAPQMISIMGQESRHLAVEKYDVHKVNQSILSAMEIT